MPAEIIDGKAVAAKWHRQAAERAARLERERGVRPCLGVILVGDNPASVSYVTAKERACAADGILSRPLHMKADATQEEVLEAVRSLASDPAVHGILVQLPLPKQIAAHEAEILNRIDPAKDVDGFHPVNVGRLVTGEEGLVPCTPAGCIRMLELAGIPMDGKKAVVIGRSNIVGKPMFHLLLARNATVTVCHSHTENLAEITREADILVAAIGKPRFVTADMVKPGATVIDVGINRIAPKKLVGDVDFEQVKEVAGAITPVPGGVGLLTVAMLMQNVVKAMEMQMK